MSPFDPPDDRLEIPPIERREAPRSPVQGLTVTFLDGAPLLRRPFEVAESGLNSVFLAGEDAAAIKLGMRYRLRLRYLGRTVDTKATCVRIEGGRRVGAVLRVDDDEVVARTLLWEALQPSGIPYGHH